MSQFDREMKAMRSSWKSYAGSMLLTFLIFFLIALAQLGLVLDRPETETALMDIYLPPLPPAPPPPPPPAVTRPARSLVSKNPATFDLQFPDEMDSVEKDPIEHLPLEFLKLTFGSEMEPEIYIDFDLRSQLRAVKPNVMDRLIVYDRDQVDENPVRLHAPNYYISLELLEERAELLVLYRVTKKGRTEDIHVLESTNEEVNKFALKIISGSRFRPARKNGNPVNIWVQHEMILKKKRRTDPFGI